MQFLMLSQAQAQSMRLAMAQSERRQCLNCSAPEYNQLINKQGKQDLQTAVSRYLAPLNSVFRL